VLTLLSNALLSQPVFDAQIEAARARGYLLPPAAERKGNNLNDFNDFHLKKWLKPRPESGLDCLDCAEFAVAGLRRADRCRARPRVFAQPPLILVFFITVSVFLLLLFLFSSLLLRVEC